MLCVCDTIFIQVLIRNSLFTCPGIGILQVYISVIGFRYLLTIQIINALYKVDFMWSIIWLKTILSGVRKMLMQIIECRTKNHLNMNSEFNVCLNIRFHAFNQVLISQIITPIRCRSTSIINYCMLIFKLLYYYIKKFG